MQRVIWAVGECEQLFVKRIQRVRSRMLMVPPDMLRLEKKACLESQRRKEHMVRAHMSVRTVAMFTLLPDRSIILNELQQVEFF